MRVNEGRLAQMEERFPYKEEVGGSIPSTPTPRSLRFMTLIGCFSHLGWFWGFLTVSEGAVA